MSWAWGASCLARGVAAGGGACRKHRAGGGKRVEHLPGSCCGGNHGLGGCAMVAAPYGDPAGILGVIGPARMDYGRIIPLVDYCSQMVTDKLSS